MEGCGNIAPVWVVVTLSVPVVAPASLRLSISNSTSLMGLGILTSTSLMGLVLILLVMVYDFLKVQI